MQQSEIVEHLYADRRVETFHRVLAESLGCHKQQHGAYALSAFLKPVCNRAIEAFRCLRCVILFYYGLFHHSGIIAYAFHMSVSLRSDF